MNEISTKRKTSRKKEAKKPQRNKTNSIHSLCAHICVYVSAIQCTNVRQESYPHLKIKKKYKKILSRKH